MFRPFTPCFTAKAKKGVDARHEAGHDGANA
jgi:hypothetical protein